MLWAPSACLLVCIMLHKRKTGKGRKNEKQRRTGLTGLCELNRPDHLKIVDWFYLFGVLGRPTARGPVQMA